MGNKYSKQIKALSLFSSGGMAETYFKDLAVKVVLANEIIKERCDFYNHLYPEAEMIRGDITDDDVRNNIIAKAKKYGVNFIIATPPCQGMSVAGKNDPYDPRNQLITYAIDVINNVNPDLILLENVPQQLKTKIYYNNKLVLVPDFIKESLGTKYNYNDESIIRCMDHGIPQMRKRNIFLFTNKKSNLVWNYPKVEEKQVTLRDAISDIPTLDPFIREGEDITLKIFPDYHSKKDRALQLSKFHKPPTHSLNHITWMMHTPSGQTAFDNNIYFPKKKDGKRISGHFNTYRRHSWDTPSRSLTQNNGVISSLACVHPGRLINDSNNEKLRIYSDPRCFTIYELFIVSSLPRDWDLPSWSTDSLVRKIIGEGVPPLLTKKILQEII